MHLCYTELHVAVDDALVMYYSQLINLLYCGMSIMNLLMFFLRD